MKATWPCGMVSAQLARWQDRFAESRAIRGRHVPIRLRRDHVPSGDSGRQNSPPDRRDQEPPSDRSPPLRNVRFKGPACGRGRHRRRARRRISHGEDPPQGRPSRGPGRILPGPAPVRARGVQLQHSLRRFRHMRDHAGVPDPPHRSPPRRYPGAGGPLRPAPQWAPLPSDEGFHCSSRHGCSRDSVSCSLQSPCPA